MLRNSEDILALIAVTMLFVLPVVVIIQARSLHELQKEIRSINTRLIERGDAQHNATTGILEWVEPEQE